MGDGHRRAAEVQGRVVQPADEGGFEVFVFGGDGQGQVDAVVAGGVEAGVVERRGDRVAHGVADHAVDPGVGAQGVPAVEVFEVVDRRLSGRGGHARRGVVGPVDRRRVQCGKGQQRPEFLGQHPRGQPRLAHAQGDGGLESAADQLEGLDVVPQRPRPPGDLDHPARRGVGHGHHPPLQVRGPGLEVVGREDQPAAHVGPGLVGVVDHQADFLPQVRRALVGRQLEVQVRRGDAPRPEAGVFQQADAVRFVAVVVPALPRGPTSHDAGQRRAGHQLRDRVGPGERIDAQLHQVRAKLRGTRRGGQRGLQFTHHQRHTQSGHPRSPGR